MTDSTRHVYRPPLGSWQRFALVGAALALLIPLTQLGQHWTMKTVEATLQERRDRSVRDAFRYIDVDFEQRQDALLDRAERLATAPPILEALRAYQRGQQAEAREQLVRYLASRPLPDRLALEIYDPTPRVLAWQGYHIGLDATPLSMRFLSSFQTTLISDGTRRQGLVVWWPIRDGSDVVGAVRAVELIASEAPVQNQYLRDYSLADQWSRVTGLAVSIQEAPTAESSRPRHTRTLQGADGTLLAHVVIQPPSAERLYAEGRIPFEQMRALWISLVLFWCLFGGWRWYRLALPSSTTLTPWTFWTATARLALLSLAWWASRYILIALDIPHRWQRGKTPLAPLFDPSHLASTFGSGLFRSIGDLFLTALFMLIFAGAILNLLNRLRTDMREQTTLSHWGQHPIGTVPSPIKFTVVVIGFVLSTFGLATVLAIVARQAVLNSTLDYFSRTGLLPDVLVILVFVSLLLLTLATTLLTIGLAWCSLHLLMRYWPFGPSLWKRAIPIVLLVVVGTIATYIVVDGQAVTPWLTWFFLLVTSISAAFAGFYWSGRVIELLKLRSVLLAVLVMTGIIYPLLYQGLDIQKRQRMTDAAAYFSEGRDPNVLFAIELVLEEIHDNDHVYNLLSIDALTNQVAALDSLAAQTLQGSMLASLGTYDVSLTLLDTTGTPIGRSYAAEQRFVRSALDQIDREEFDILRLMHQESGQPDALIEQITGRLEANRFEYAGILPLSVNRQTVGWAMVRAEPQSPFLEGTTPFPRVLAPAGYYGNLYGDLSMAEFRNGVLARSYRREFGRYRIDQQVQERLYTQPHIWRREQVKENTYQTYYKRLDRPRGRTALSLGDATIGASVVAVRASAISTFDHLYYLLRLTLAGLVIGIPLYVVGLLLRWQSGLVPAKRTRFRDKVLNAFLAVGIVTVAAVGWVGREVIVEETDGAIQDWLRRHLERVERTLTLEAQGNERPYQVLNRLSIDSLSARVGLDLNVYQGERLIASSRPRMVSDRLIDERLAAEVFRDLFFDGFRLTYAEEKIGSFTYQAGYRALPDETGRPRYVIGIPTLPEQERIEEERARTVAYLFGALLLLVVMVMLTASLIANALARPIGRLREGLRETGKGRFAQVEMVKGRDEIGDLMRTFNSMQQQLAESRRQLTQQERQLAWQEMARQVAHEIKNPLTPMKLSVQHLRRAFSDIDPAHHRQPDSKKQERFSGLFDRITTTLTEQIDALARIANEFSTFARLPKQILEPLDLNAVIQEAVALMQEEQGAEIALSLHESPLVLQADHEELRRIYINLIKNAIQAMPEGATSRIRITSQQITENGSTCAYSTVTDYGTGIPEELRDKIFQPNFSTKTSGTGLGLAIIQKAVMDLRGSIGFDTEMGKGTTFWIRLPLAEEPATTT